MKELKPLPEWLEQTAPDGLLSVLEVCELFSIKEGVLRRWIEKGSFPEGKFLSQHRRKGCLISKLMGKPRQEKLFWTKEQILIEFEKRKK